MFSMNFILYCLVLCLVDDLRDTFQPNDSLPLVNSTAGLNQVRFLDFTIIPKVILFIHDLYLAPNTKNSLSKSITGACNRGLGDYW
jgi:hypothetical protein